MPASTHLWTIAERFRGVQVECDDALRVIDRYDSPEALHYVDPPYPKGTRSHRWGRSGYVHEYTALDHELLLAAVRSARGMVVISGYRCDRYDRALVDWRREDKAARTPRERFHRCIHVNWEAVFAEEWEETCQPRPGVNFGWGTLQDLMVRQREGDGLLFRGRVPFWITKRERVIVATVVQWLGTACGFAFLQKCLRRCGYRLVDISMEERIREIRRPREPETPVVPTHLARFAALRDTRPDHRS